MTKKTTAHAVADADASAQVFLRAFYALPKLARRKVLASLAETEDLREDVEAALLWEQRKDEPRQSFEEYVAEYEAGQK